MRGHKGVDLPKVQAKYGTKLSSWRNMWEDEEEKTILDDLTILVKKDIQWSLDCCNIFWWSSLLSYYFLYFVSLLWKSGSPSCLYYCLFIFVDFYFEVKIQTSFWFDFDSRVPLKWYRKLKKIQAAFLFCYHFLAFFR